MPEPATQKRIRYYTRRAAGICVLCGKRRAEVGVRCLECVVVVLRRYDALKARRKCVTCGKHFAQRGLRCCVCAEKNHSAVQRCQKRGSFPKQEKFSK